MSRLKAHKILCYAGSLMNSSVESICAISFGHLYPFGYVLVLMRTSLLYQKGSVEYPFKKLEVLKNNVVTWPMPRMPP